MDLDARYPSATAEKAFLDWLYLGASRYSKIAGPAFDLELERLGSSRLRRLASTMGLTEELAAWRARIRNYDADPDVRENISRDLEM